MNKQACSYSHYSEIINAFQFLFTIRKISVSYCSAELRSLSNLVTASTIHASAVSDSSVQDQSRYLRYWARPYSLPECHQRREPRKSKYEAVGVLRASLHREVSEYQSASTWNATRQFLSTKNGFNNIEVSWAPIIVNNDQNGAMNKIHWRLQKINLTIMLFVFARFRFIFSLQQAHLVHNLCRLIDKLQFTIYSSQKLPSRCKAQARPSLLTFRLEWQRVG